MMFLSNPIVRVGAFLLIAVLVSVLVISQNDEDPEVLSASNSHQQSLEAVSPSSLQEAPSDIRKTVPSEAVLAYKSKYGPLPGSLEGTIMQQALALDASGNLRISADLQRVFDFFLSTIEEENLDVILQRIQEYLDFYLDEPALSQSLAVMNQYIDFKKALFDFEVQRSDALKSMAENGTLGASETYMALLEEQLLAQKELRAEHLDPEVHEAFYADEEVYDDYTLARLKVQSDKTLSHEEKQQQLDAIDAQAPAELVASRREAQLTDILKEKTQALKQQGAGQEEIKALRTEMLGVEAAERFEALDQERAQWQQRVDNFLAQRRAILDTQGLSEQAKSQQIDQLRRNQFDEREQIRVSVYERRADSVQ